MAEEPVVQINDAIAPDSKVPAFATPLSVDMQGACGSQECIMKGHRVIG